MKVVIELKTGPNHREYVYKEDIQGNIDVLDRIMSGKPQAQDSIRLLDTRSILVGIQNQLPER